MPDPITIPTDTLLPPQWLRGQKPFDFYIFNPAVIRYQDRLLMVYRVDFGRDKTTRVACAICRLDDNFQVFPGSIVPLSDTITGGDQNHYDSRFLIYRDRLFIHYNNNFSTRPNQIHLVELNPDTLEAKAPARLLALDGPRREIEKNWMFFEHEGDLLAVYAIAPHTLLQVDLSGAGAVACRPAFKTDWDVLAYTARWGEPRGGTPPVRVGECYISVFHSRLYPQSLFQASQFIPVRNLNQVGWLNRLKRWLRDKLNPLKIYGGVYGFTANPPFAPLFIRPQPLLYPHQEKRQRRPTADYLSPRRVVFPCGLVHLDHDRWLVSYGVHDERCSLRVLTNRDLFGATYAETAGDRQ